MDAIYYSPTFWNTSFVAKTIRDIELNPQPVQGFSDLPDYDYQDARWRRMVERYPWGAALYLSDREIGNHATIVVIGNLDLLTGEVKRVDGLTENINTHLIWYRELVAAITPGADLSGIVPDLEEEDESAYPKCIGYYEEAPTCSGGMNQAGEIEEPCSWCDRCAALQRHCLDTGTTIEQWLSGKDDHEVVLATARLVSPESVPPEKPAPKVSPERISPPSVHAEEVSKSDGWANAMTAETCRELAFDFWDKLLVALGMDEASDLDHPEVGECFLADNQKSRTITGYRSMAERDVSFVRLWPRRYRRCIYVQLPAKQNHPALAGLQEFVGSWKYSRYDATIKSVGKEVSIETVIAAIVELRGELGIGFPRETKGER